jgi:hypothetical protein
MLSKKDFINAINDVEKVNRYQEGLNNYLRKNDVEGYIFQPDCSSTVINLLHNIMGEKDKDEWIDYYCFELDFGKKWKEGTINIDGKDITLQTPEDLYNLLDNQA